MTSCRAMLIIALFCAVPQINAQSDDELHVQARRHLHRLDALKAFEEIRKKISKSNSASEIAPFVTSDLARPIIKIGEMKDKEGKNLEKIKAITQPFPGKVQIIETRVDGQTATIKVVPAADNAIYDSRKTKSEIGLVTMRYERGIWKIQNTRRLGLSEWCLKAAKGEPPEIPCLGHVEGKKFTVTGITTSGGTMIFDLSSPHTLNDIQIYISDKKFGRLPEILRSREKRSISHIPLVFRRPLTHPLPPSERDSYEIFPSIKIVEKDTGEDIFTCESGYGFALKVNNFRRYTMKDQITGSVRTAEAASAKIYLRLPDRYNSYLEGYFDLVWDPKNQRW